MLLLLLLLLLPWNLMRGSRVGRVRHLATLNTLETGTSCWLNDSLL